jgi:hypothetical protein
MLRALFWISLGVFVASTGVLLAIRSPGYTSTASENGKYYVAYRSTRYEVTNEEYESATFRIGASEICCFVMLISLFGVGGVHTLRKHLMQPPTLRTTSLHRN